MTLRQKELENVRKDEEEYQRKNAIAIQKMQENALLKEVFSYPGTSSRRYLISIKVPATHFYQKQYQTIADIRESLTKSHIVSAEQKRAEREEARKARILSELHLTASVTINVRIARESFVFHFMLNFYAGSLRYGIWRVPLHLRIDSNIRKVGNLKRSPDELEWYK